MDSRMRGKDGEGRTVLVTLRDGSVSQSPFPEPVLKDLAKGHHVVVVLRTAHRERTPRTISARGDDGFNLAALVRSSRCTSPRWRAWRMAC